MRTKEVEFYVAIDADGDYDVQTDRDCLGDDGGLSESYTTYKLLITLPVPGTTAIPTIEIDASAAKADQPINPGDVKVKLKLPE